LKREWKGEKTNRTVKTASSNPRRELVTAWMVGEGGRGTKGVKVLPLGASMSSSSTVVDMAGEEGEVGRRWWSEIGERGERRKAASRWEEVEEKAKDNEWDKVWTFSRSKIEARHVSINYSRCRFT
jgi:hypothetical protein